MARPGIKGAAIGAGVGAILAAGAAVIAPWEGFYPRTYLDIVKVPTVCFGETDKAAVEEGRKRAFTKPECLDMLAHSLPKYYDGMMGCIQRADVPDSVKVAGLSMTYNIGVGAVCRSTFVRRINAGDFKGACDAMLLFNRAGGRVVKGLDNRRRAERETCLKGLPT